jgi:hypothetical protein
MVETSNEINQALLRLPINQEVPKDVLEYIQTARASKDYIEYLKQLERVRRWQIRIERGFQKGKKRE